MLYYALTAFVGTEIWSRKCKGLGGVDKPENVNDPSSRYDRHVLHGRICLISDRSQGRGDSEIDGSGELKEQAVDRSVAVRVSLVALTPRIGWERI